MSFNISVIVKYRREKHPSNRFSVLRLHSLSTRGLSATFLLTTGV